MGMSQKKGRQNPPEMVDFSKIPMVFRADFQTHPKWTLFFDRKVLKLEFVWVGVVGQSGCAYVGEKKHESINHKVVI